MYLSIPWFQWMNDTCKVSFILFYLYFKSFSLINYKKREEKWYKEYEKGYQEYERYYKNQTSHIHHLLNGSYSSYFLIVSQYLYYLSYSSYISSYIYNFSQNFHILLCFFMPIFGFFYIFSHLLLYFLYVLSLTLFYIISHIFCTLFHIFCIISYIFLYFLSHSSCRFSQILYLFHVKYLQDQILCPYIDLL